jgi:hypothetical protein
MIAFWIAFAIQVFGFMVSMRHLEKNNWNPFFEKFNITTTLVSLIITVTLSILMILHFGFVLPLVLMLAVSAITWPIVLTKVITNGGLTYTLHRTLISGGFYIAMYLWLLFI